MGGIIVSVLISLSGAAVLLCKTSDIKTGGGDAAFRQHQRHSRIRDSPSGDTSHSVLVLAWPQAFESPDCPCSSPSKEGHTTPPCVQKL